MKFWTVLLVFGGAACSPKQESPSLVSGETTEVEAAVDQAQEGCVSACIDSMAMQARSAQSIEDTCRQRCLGESQPLSPQSLE